MQTCERIRPMEVDARFRDDIRARHADLRKSLAAIAARGTATVAALAQLDGLTTAQVSLEIVGQRKELDATRFQEMHDELSTRLEAQEWYKSYCDAGRELHAQAMKDWAACEAKVTDALRNIGFEVVPADDASMEQWQCLALANHPEVRRVNEWATAMERLSFYELNSTSEDAPQVFNATRISQLQTALTKCTKKLRM